MRCTKWVLLFLVALQATRSARAAVVLAGPITELTSGHKYYLLGQDNWTNSQNEAILLGGNLATINSLAENNFVISQFANFWRGAARAVDRPQ